MEVYVKYCWVDEIGVTPGRHVARPGVVSRVPYWTIPLSQWCHRGHWPPPPKLQRALLRPTPVSFWRVTWSSVYLQSEERALRGGFCSILFYSRNTWKRMRILECSYMPETPAMDSMFFASNLRSASQAGSHKSQVSSPFDRLLARDWTQLHGSLFLLEACGPQKFHPSLMPPPFPASTRGANCRG